MTINLLKALPRDLSYAWRTMRKSPGFALTVIATLALGIGANTVIFSAVHAVLLKPLAYRDPDRLVRLSGGATLAHFDELKTGKAFSEVGAFAIGTENMSLSGTAEPQMLNAARVSANFLHILGVEPVLGRGFSSEEDRPGAAAVAMISSELWQRRFNSDPSIIGKTITLAAVPHVVVGVVPADFDFPFEQTDVWVTKPSEWSAMSAQSRRLSPFLAVFGRLKPEIRLDQASAELAVIQHRYALAHPAMLDAKPKGPVRAKLWKDEVVSKVQSMLWMLLGAVGFVLLIACSNVAGLLLARGVSRSRELAVRSALGANRTRLVVHLLVESLLLSIVGGALGILMAALVLNAVSRTNPLDLPRATGIHLDGSVLAFASILSIATGVLFGLAPSIGASRLDLLPALKMGGDSIGRLRSGLKPRGLLVIGQVSLSIILLIGASLLIESVMHLRATDPGFNPEHLLTTQITLPAERYDTDSKRTAFFEEVVHRVRSIPGVRSATIALTLPMTPFPGTPVQDAARAPLKLNERPIATALIVMPGYFRTLEIPIRRGRDFTEVDRAGARRVAIIDEDLARRFWPSYPKGRDPIGQRLVIGGVNPQPAEIVGIVAHTHQNLEDNAWPETVYMPFAQTAQSHAMLAVRTSWGPDKFIHAVGSEVKAVDRDQSISKVHTMDELLEAQLGRRRSFMLLLGTFAAIAVLLAALGLYGLVAYSVVQRTKELGLRQALGAVEIDILSQVMGPALKLTLAGVAIGVAGAFAVTRFLESLLFHITPIDPLTFAGVGVLLLFVAGIASYIPARRAMRLDPMTALRLE